MLRSTASLLAVLALGCAAQSPSDEIAGGGAGGKADGETESGPMLEVDETEQSYLHAADAECLHMNFTRNETYDQAVKVLCLPRGGSAAPIALYVAVTPLGEADGAYKVFHIPHFVSDYPESVEFRMVGDKAIYTFKVKEYDWSNETDELVFVTRSVSATVSFSGEGWEPTLATSYTFE